MQAETAMIGVLVLVAMTADAPKVSDEIIVTANRIESRVSEAPASVVVLSPADLRSAAAPAIDEVLRQVPGFTLFRRSGSRTANPTTQGASLRAIGASGASRTVVLDDGIPLNDPFGGWVIWGRVPRASLARIEVVRGGASELYGSGALSGVIQMIRRDGEPGITADLSIGMEETADASFYGSRNAGRWDFSLAAELFRTGGYVAVREEDRGPVDEPVNSRRGVADLTVSHSLEQRRLFVRASHFEESRNNGTPLQINDTRTNQLSAGFHTIDGGSAWTVRGFLTDQLYHQTFSAIEAGRSAERLIRLQEVPVEAFGGAVQLVRAAGSHHTLVGGIEGRRVEGFSNESVPGTSVRTSAGGRQEIAGGFLEDVFIPHPRLSLTGALRWDSWRNQDRSDSELSPRLAARFELAEGVALVGSLYRSFRAPTLNELYRSFRVGNVLTLANEDLGAERLAGSEIGAVTFRARSSLRATLFVMEVERNIANITLSVEPNLTTRRRENLGKTRSQGLELDGQWMVRPWLRLSGGYLFADSTVQEFAENPALEGRRVAQIPRHAASLQLQAERSRASAAIQTRWSSDQFEDDLNTITLDGFTVIDALVSTRISERLEAFVAVENLLDTTYEIGATPIVTLGPGRFARIGLRVH